MEGMNMLEVEGMDILDVDERLSNQRPKVEGMDMVEEQSSK
jgi:hypothetical protein